MNRYTGKSLRKAAKMLPWRATFWFGAPSARWTMYWSVHQYQRPMTGAQIAMPSQGKLALKYQACLTIVAGGILLQHRRPGAFDAGRNQRLPEVEHVGTAERRAVTPQPPSLMQAVDRQQRRADDQDDDLDGVVVGHRAHAAEHRVETGQHDDQHRADPEAVDHDAADGDLHLRQQRAEHHAAGENADGDLRDDERDDARRSRARSATWCRSGAPETPAW